MLIHKDALCRPRQILVNFTITGGALLGVGNGDANDHEADKATNNIAVRSVFNGLAQVIVQSISNQTGSIILTATATGLTSTNVAITAANTFPPASFADRSCRISRQ